MNEELGITGNGVIIGGCDTGVDQTHPALSSRWRGNFAPWWQCWRDDINHNTQVPSDGYGHGTHTMGSMVATDSNSALPLIAGMAPHAQWIACKGCETGDCSEASLDACADWVLAPDHNSDNRPQVVNNSWSDTGGNTWYLPKVQAWRLVKILI